jgi:hypothetical protein
MTFSPSAINEKCRPVVVMTEAKETDARGGAQPSYFSG